MNAAKFLALLIGGPEATWNPLDKASGVTLSNNNLTAAGSGVGAERGVRATLGRSTGKWHFEVVVDALSGARPLVGFANASASLTSPFGLDASSVQWESDDKLYFNNVVLATPGTFTTGDVLVFEPDLDAQTVYIQKNSGSRQGPYSFAGLSGAVYPAVMFQGGQATLRTSVNQFTVAPTSGYSAWGN